MILPTMCLCLGVGGRGGGHNLLKMLYCFFSCFRPFLKPSLKGIADTRIKDLINHMSGLGKQGRMIKLVDIR